jgi:hypothetical protein
MFSFRSPERDLPKRVKEVNMLIKITPEKIYAYYKLESYGFDHYYYILGETEDGRKVLFDGKKLTSEEGSVNITAIQNSDEPLSDRKRNLLMYKLFPNTHQEKKVEKVDNIRDLMTGPNSKKVFWKIGRKTRGGDGIEGKAKDLTPSLSGATQDRLKVFGDKYKVTWGDMIVFDNNGAINLVTVSNEQLPNGNYYYYDKFGHGLGGNSKVIEGPPYQKLR